MKRSVMMVLVLLSLACESAPRAATPPPSAPGAAPSVPVAVIETSEVLRPPAPSLDDVALPDPLEDEEEEALEEGAAGGAREIHPHGGMSDCLEMYSACSPDPDEPRTQRCTSAPLLLACGQTGTIPGGDTLRCVCP